MWEQSNERGVKIHLQGAWKQFTTRDNDLFLMDTITSTIKDHLTLEQITDVRIYLQVSWLSDITIDDGSTIHEWALYGPPAKSPLQWPKKRVPLAHNMKLWRETIRGTFFGEKGIYSQHLGSETPTPTSKMIQFKVLSM